MRKVRFLYIGIIAFVATVIIGMQDIKASKKIVSDFPDSITADYGALFSEDNTGIYIYKKEYDTGAKAICTYFWNSPPKGKCTATTWTWDNLDNANTTENKKIAVAVGAMITKARTIANKDGFSMDWKQYFYLEMAVNNFLYHYNGKRAVNNVSRISKWSSITSNSIYRQIFAAGETAYKNYGKTAIKLSNAKITQNGNKVNVEVRVTCTDAAGKNTKCSAQVADTLELTVAGKETKTKWPKCQGNNKTNCVDFEKNSTDMNYTYYYYGVYDSDIDASTNISAKITTKNKVTYGVAQEYYCGSGHQNLTLNSVKNMDVYDSVSKTITKTTGSCSLKIVKKNGNKTLNGAKFEIYKDGNKVDDGTTDAKGELLFEGLTVGGHYTYKEVAAPSGYNLDSQEYTLDVTEQQCNVTKDIENSVAKGKLKIYKVDENKKAVSGAKIKVYTISTSSGSDGNLEMGENESTGGDYVDPDNNNYTYNYLCFDDAGNYKGENTNCSASGYKDYFITGDTPKEITDLTIGKMYYIDEEAVPEGSDYAIKVGSASVNVQDANEYSVELVNNHSKFKISKQDITSKKEIKGAKLQIFDSRGVERYNWTSTDKPYEIIGLEDGEYTLVETQAPNGYTMAESIKFTIENGKIKNDADNTIVMYDTFIVEVPDTLSSKNIIAMIIGLVLVVAGTGALVYEIKKKTA